MPEGTAGGLAPTPDEVVTAADHALYHAKESGRDRVSVHRGDEIVPVAPISTDAIYRRLISPPKKPPTRPRRPK